MTISTSTGRVQYNGNSSTTVFATTFKLLDSSHVKVILTDSSAVDAVQVETTDYTVSGVGNSTATITMIAAPATGEKLTLKLNPPLTQVSDLINGQSFDAEIIEQALDLSTQVDQGTDEKIVRCLRAAESVSTSFDGEMGPLTALYIPRINAAKTGFDLVPATDLALSGTFTAADGNFLVGDGSDFVEESGATARASLGLGSIATQASTAVSITGGTIAGVTSLGVAGSITVTGTVDGVDVAALKTDVDGFPDTLKNLTAGEVGELENIGSTSISATQWGYLGATDQSLATTDAVSFTNGDFTGTEALKVPSGTTAQRPGTPVDGDLRVNTTTATLEVFRDTAWRGLESGGGTMSNVVEDTSPQLGGSLDVNGNSIVSASAGNIAITPDTTGDVILDGLKWPQADGTANYVLETDGAGQLSWVANSGGGLSNIVEDTSPQLGGQLDINGNSIGDGTKALLSFTEDASAVNNINIENQATGGGPIIASVGSDTNIDINITPKGTGSVVIDGISHPQSDGTSGQVLQTDGSGQLSFATAGGSGAWSLISTATASSSASISFTGLTSAYYEYMIVLDHVLAATDNVSFQVRTSSNNGSSYDSSAGNYAWGLSVVWGGATHSSYGSTSDTSMDLTATSSAYNMSNSAQDGWSGRVSLLNPSGTKYTRITAQGWHLSSSGTQGAVTAAGHRKSTSAVDAIQFTCSSGNIASGTFKLYGLSAT